MRPAKGQIKQKIYDCALSWQNKKNLYRTKACNQLNFPKHPRKPTKQVSDVTINMQPTHNLYITMLYICFNLTPENPQEILTELHSIINYKWNCTSQFIWLGFLALLGWCIYGAGRGIYGACYGIHFFLFRTVFATLLFIYIKNSWSLCIDVVVDILHLL